MSDIGESMAASWLRHVKKCKIVTTNWTVDVEENDIFLKKMNNLLIKVQQTFKKKGIEIFPNKELSSIIKQAECDVVGFQFGSGKISKLYGIDVAVHSKGKGLDYGDNIKKIIEKSLRTALCFYTILGVGKDCPIEIYFLTPKMAEKERLAEIVKQFNEFGQKNGYDFSDIKWVDTHLQAAYFSQAERENDALLYELSNFSVVEKFIAEKKKSRGTFKLFTRRIF